VNLERIGNLPAKLELNIILLGANWYAVQIKPMLLVLINTIITLKKKVSTILSVRDADQKKGVKSQTAESRKLVRACSNCGFLWSIDRKNPDSRVFLEPAK
jgi:hypothetical protein